MAQRADVDGACAVAETLSSHMQVNQGTSYAPQAYARTQKFRTLRLVAAVALEVRCALTQNDTSLAGLSGHPRLCVRHMHVSWCSG